MKLSLLTFLPHATVLWAYEQARFERLLGTPFKWLFALVDSYGVWFTHRGDEVLWLWPWRRDGKGAFISVGLSGNASLGDARYDTLAQLDRDWEGYFEARNRQATEWDATVGDGIIWATASEPIEKGYLVVLNEDGTVRKAT